MSVEESIRIVPQGEIAIMEFDLVGEKVNKLNTPIMMRLKELLEELRSSKFRALIIKSNKPKIFIAGADIEEIKSMNKREEFEKAVELGQSVINLIEDLPMPTIAAINGACMGGGCELTLACDYRIASDDNSTRIGLPETKLGIIPGFGGCVRMPRIIGLQASLDIILQGKAVKAAKAKKIGLVDKVVHPAILEVEAIKWAHQILDSGAKKRRVQHCPKGALNKVLESFLGRSVVYSKAKDSVLDATHGHYPAPLKAIEVISRTLDMVDRTEALRIEREAFSDLAITDASKNLIHVFYLTEMVKKQTGVADDITVEALPVEHLGILGAGTMGGGIAYVAADKGIHVRMKDINNEALARGFKHAYDLWAKLFKRKSITKFELQQKMDLVTGGLDFAGFKQMDVVIEAIVEDLDIKRKVISETAKNSRANTIIVSNTSSLSISEMGKAHPAPEFFAGMHFFNPVNKMPLVEVIRGEKSSDQTIATVFELAKKMGKVPVVVRDGPGFLVNRLLLPYMSEAAFLLNEGMSIEFVDKAYVQEFGMPMGPFALMDEVGLDVCIKVLKIFKKAFGARIEMAECLEALEKTNRLGRKNGKGFYQYSEKGERGAVDAEIYSTLGLKEPTNPHTSKECIERGVFMMINECSLALYEDRIVESPHEIDLAMIMGTGFPPFRGGLLKYADTLGTEYIVDQLEFYGQQKGARLKPNNPLRNMAKTKRKFYNN
jgi:3-hydroxyacyl-CoA dehydrogenase/enoyl-CoA hydratase/3-hydroxybutyryl-CoA epimerase